MGAMASQITSLTIVHSAVYSGADQRKYQSSASLTFVRGIHRWPVNSPHKGPVTRKIWWRHHIHATPGLRYFTLSAMSLWIVKWRDCEFSVASHALFRLEVRMMFEWKETFPIQIHLKISILFSPKCVQNKNDDDKSMGRSCWTVKLKDTRRKRSGVQVIIKPLVVTHYSFHYWFQPLFALWQITWD